MRQLRKVLGPVVKSTDLTRQYPDCDGVANCILSAIAEAKLDTKTLNLCSNNFEHGIAAVAFNLRESRFDDLCDGLEKLTVLKLGFGGYDGMRGKWFTNHDNDFLNLLNAVTGLEKLAIRWNGPYEEEESGWTPENCSSWITGAVTAALPEVKLSRLRITEQQFVDFFKAQRVSLRLLELRNVAIPEGERWSNVLRCIVQELDLESVDLQSLERGDWSSGRVVIEQTVGADGRWVKLRIFSFVGRRMSRPGC